MSNVIAFSDLKTRLEAADLNLPIQWPNEPFAAPDNPAPFLTVEFSGGFAEPIELGGANWLAQGQAWVHVLVPINTGVDVAFATVDALMDVFRGPPLEPVVYERITADPGSPGEGDGNYWRTSVSADWHLQTFVARS